MSSADVKNLLEVAIILVTSILLIFNFSFMSIILLSVLVSISFKSRGMAALFSVFIWFLIILFILLSVLIAASA